MKWEAHRDVSIKIVGVHLAGANTKKSAMVRASISLRRILSGLPAGLGHDSFASAFFRFFPHLPVYSNADSIDKKDGSSPLIWEAFSPDIGPQGIKDSDTRLLEAARDLGGADIFVIDAPLTLPPCVTCELICPGTMGCVVPAVEQMRSQWETQKKFDKRLRAPQPYVDRFFENYARHVFKKEAVFAGYEFSAPLGSNRAPLTARAIRFAREITAIYPNAMVIETNAYASTIGWALSAGLKVDNSQSFKTGPAAKQHRTELFKGFEKASFALRSASLHESLYESLASQLETFYAAMGALSVWGLLNGEAFLPQEFLQIDPENPLEGWALIPKHLSHHALNEHLKTSKRSIS